MNEKLKAYLQVERDKFDSEKQIIQKDMKLKDTLIEQLNKQVKESQEKVKLLEAKMPQGEKDLKEKLYNYEKNFDALIMMYHATSTQKKLLSKDMKVVESKL
jgi:predicted  nucleic acid-binding Zn-ribbon protein